MIAMQRLTFCLIMALNSVWCFSSGDIYANDFDIDLLQEMQLDIREREYKSEFYESIIKYKDLPRAKLSLERLKESYRNYNAEWLVVEVDLSILDVEEMLAATPEVRDQQFRAYTEFHDGAREFEAGDAEEAARKFLESARLFKAHFSKPQPELFVCFDRLARLSFYAGQLEHSIAIFAHSSNLAKEVFGESSPSFAGVISGLGHFLIEAGDYEQAKQLSLIALMNRMQCNGRFVYQRHRALNFLAYCCILKEEFSEANEVLALADCVYPQTLKNQSLSGTTITYLLMGMYWHANGKSSVAISYFEIGFANDNQLHHPFPNEMMLDVLKQYRECALQLDMTAKVAELDAQIRGIVDRKKKYAETFQPIRVEDGSLVR